MLTFGCNGQQANTPISNAKKFPDSLVEVKDTSAPQVAEVSLKDSITGHIKQSDSAPKNDFTKKVTNPPPTKKIETQQTTPAKIWKEDQVKFLESVDKILLFNVKITEIGSRKLELDSQLGIQDHKEFIKRLLSQESYPATEMVESSDGKKFEPNYQMMLESGEEKLTLLFDGEGLKMVVANLYGREKYAIEPLLMEYVDELKTKQ